MLYMKIPLHSVSKIKRTRFITITIQGIKLRDFIYKENGLSFYLSEF